MVLDSHKTLFFCVAFNIRLSESPEIPVGIFLLELSETYSLNHRELMWLQC